MCHVGGDRYKKQIDEILRVTVFLYVSPATKACIWIAMSLFYLFFSICILFLLRFYAQSYYYYCDCYHHYFLALLSDFMENKCVSNLVQMHSAAIQNGVHCRQTKHFVIQWEAHNQPHDIGLIRISEQYFCYNISISTTIFLLYRFKSHSLCGCR